jgi:hypothetical protein
LAALGGRCGAPFGVSLKRDCRSGDDRRFGEPDLQRIALALGYARIPAAYDDDRVVGETGSVKATVSRPQLICSVRTRRSSRSTGERVGAIRSCDNAQLGDGRHAEAAAAPAVDVFRLFDRRHWEISLVWR